MRKSLDLIAGKLVNIYLVRQTSGRDWKWRQISATCILFQSKKIKGFGDWKKLTYPSHRVNVVIFFARERYLWFSNFYMFFLFLFVEQRGMKFIRLLQHDFHLSVCNGAFGLSRCCTHRSSSSYVIFTKAVKTLVLMCSEFTSAQRKVFYDWWIQPGIEPETQYFSDHSRRSRPLNRTSPLSL
jgi:hypothetical protein